MQYPRLGLPFFVACSVIVWGFTVSICIAIYLENAVGPTLFVYSNWVSKNWALSYHIIAPVSLLWALYVLVHTAHKLGMRMRSVGDVHKSRSVVFLAAIIVTYFVPNFWDFGFKYFCFSRSIFVQGAAEATALFSGDAPTICTIFIWRSYIYPVQGLGLSEKLRPDGQSGASIEFPSIGNSTLEFDSTLQDGYD